MIDSKKWFSNAAFLRYLRGNGRFLQVEGSTVSAPNRQADQEPFIDLYMYIIWYMCK